MNLTERQVWLKMRKEGIGSSDAPAVHNKSPYMTALELYEDKVSDDLDEESNFAMERGQQYEAVARKLFLSSYNIDNGTDETFEPKNLIYSELPILRASLDGAREDMSEIIEIKYQGLAPHKEEKIREHYWIQIQHQLLVSGAKFCWFVSYNPKDTEKALRVTKVYPDKEFIMAHIDACVTFWGMVQSKTPPEASKDDFKVLKFKGAKKKAERFMYLRSKIEELEEEYEAIREEFKAAADHPKMRCYGVKIQQLSRSGSIKYKDIPEVKALSKDYLEKFMSPSVTYYKIEPEV